MREMRTVQLNFPLSRVDEPVITRFVTEFEIEPNLLRADVDAHSGGWIVVGLSGEPGNIDRALEWVQTHGIQVVRSGAGDRTTSSVPE